MISAANVADGNEHRDTSVPATADADGHEHQDSSKPATTYADLARKMTDDDGFQRVQSRSRKNKKKVVVGESC